MPVKAKKAGPSTQKKAKKKPTAKKPAAKKTAVKKPAKKAAQTKTSKGTASKKPVKTGKKAAPKKAVTGARGPAVEKTAPKKPAAVKDAKKAAATPAPAPAEAPVLAEEVKGSDKYSIDVTEGQDNRYFVIKVNNYRNFFSLEEMRKIVRLCHDAQDERDGAARLFGWFKVNRNDVIINTKIEGSLDPALATIYNYLVNTYTSRG